MLQVTFLRCSHCSKCGGFEVDNYDVKILRVNACWSSLRELGLFNYFVSDAVDVLPDHEYF